MTSEESALRDRRAQVSPFPIWIGLLVALSIGVYVGVRVLPETIGTLLNVLPLVVLYVIAGVLVTALSGGRDPLSFGHPATVLVWPVVLLVAGVGLLLMPSEPEVEHGE